MEDDALWRLDYDGSFMSQSGADLGHGLVISGPRAIAADWQNETPATQLERGDLKAAGLSALRLYTWARLRGTKDQAIEFSALPGDVAGLKEKLNGDTPEFALLDRALLDQTVMYRVPAADELGL
jgi:hypothetical protein